MEVIRKPKPPETETISVRVIAGLKKEHAKAREIADRLDIDMTQMITNALTDVYGSITRMSTRGAASSTTPGPDERKRVNTDVNKHMDVNTNVNPSSNGEAR